MKLTIRDRKILSSIKVRTDKFGELLKRAISTPAFDKKKTKKK